MMFRASSTSVIFLGCGIALYCVGARAESCDQEIARLESTVSALPPSDTMRDSLLDTLNAARGAAPEQCEQIATGVERQLLARSPGDPTVSGAPQDHDDDVNGRSDEPMPNDEDSLPEDTDDGDDEAE